MKLKEIINIERKIIIAMIINTKFLKQSINLIDIKYVQSKEAKILVSWIFEYFHKYKKAPKNNIQDIYLEKLRNKKIQKNQAEIIEDILDNLSEESANTKINIKYLIDQTEIYCKACQLRDIAEQIEDEIDNGNVLEAEHLVTNFKPIENIKSNAVTPLGSAQDIRDAFENFGKPLIKYPGALGDMLNQYMTREGFVIFMGQNKGGKSFHLMEAAMKGLKQGKNVAYFQGGDMSKDQANRRKGIYLTKKSDLEKYCGELYVPVLDCVYNQNGECDLEDQEKKNNEPPFDGLDIKKIREDITSHELKEAFEDYYDHVPCYNCLRRKKFNKFKGTIWFKKRKKIVPLHWKDVYKLVQKKYKKMLNKMKLITYSNEDLTMSKINAELDILEKTGFFSDIIIIDYMDLLDPDRDTLNMSSRDQENKKWKRARRLSQDKKCLVLSATQSDADGFTKRFLSKKNFSEDRRKLDHVTAMIGLNMTTEEKKKGIMRINDIAARDTEGASFVYCLHRLQIGRPILGSFY